MSAVSNYGKSGTGGSWEAHRQQTL